MTSMFSQTVHLFVLNNNNKYERLDAPNVNIERIKLINQTKKLTWGGRFYTVVDVFMGVTTQPTIILLKLDDQFEQLHAADIMKQV